MMDLVGKIDGGGVEVAWIEVSGDFDDGVVEGEFDGVLFGVVRIDFHLSYND